MRKKSKLDKGITPNCPTDQYEWDCPLQDQRDSSSNPGSLSESGSDGTNASSIIPFGVYRQKGEQVERIPLETLRKRRNFIVGDMIVLPTLDQIPSFSRSPQRDSYEKLLRSLLQSKTSKKSGILLTKDIVFLLSLAEKLQPHLCDMVPTFLGGGDTFKGLERTGAKRTSKRSNSSAKRNGRKK